jgi:glycine oxidase
MDIPPLLPGTVLPRHLHIVGQGLAGSLLAWHCATAGVAVTVYHQSLAGEASTIAPGLVNPLAGRRLAMDPGFADTLSYAIGCYRQIEQQTGSRLWHGLPIVRILESADQAARLQRIQCGEQDGTPFVGLHLAAGHWPFVTGDAWGSFVTTGGGWLDVPRLVAVTRQWLATRGRLRCGEVTPADLPAGEPVVWCPGWRAAANPLWADLPHNPAKGEFLVLRFVDRAPPADYIFNRGLWLQPLGGGLWRAGARYAWDALDDQPTAEGRDSLELRLRQWCTLPFTVIDQRAGVRPIMHDTRPLVTRHPQHSNHWLMTGLGSKGALVGPALARAVMKSLTV